MTDQLNNFAYPVVVWREGYFYLALSDDDLCAHRRSLFADKVRRSRAGEWKLLSSQGRVFDITDWNEIAPAGGLRKLGLRLTGSTLACPVLMNERQLRLDEFKSKLLAATQSCYEGDKGSALQQIALAIGGARSFQEAICALLVR
ncbi:hypothetical protein [Ramlibacter albus]|uniref:Uncharacterized protein n=1 Tax=Ramlibacter albus TaxID=2079448 RepID=A0A923S2Q8_9BURK|nr:hypothetical protein [Ramlibacter albus]MBC5765650.1 hypothetical protein [Ramlibacter albus]